MARACCRVLTCAAVCRRVLPCAAVCCRVLARLSAGFGRRRRGPADHYRQPRLLQVLLQLPDNRPPRVCVSGARQLGVRTALSLEVPLQPLKPTRLEAVPRPQVAARTPRLVITPTRHAKQLYTSDRVGRCRPSTYPKRWCRTPSRRKTLPRPSPHATGLRAGAPLIVRVCLGLAPFWLSTLLKKKQN